LKNGLLIAVIAIQLLIALTSQGATRSLAELAAFFIIIYVVLSRRQRRRQPRHGNDTDTFI
jgi:preprotein translocase subunit YajC